MTGTKQVATTPSHVEQGTDLTRTDAAQQQAIALYDMACTALANAVRIDEVLTVRDQSERIQLYARQTKNAGLMADAVELRMRAERRLGEEIIDAKQSGQIAEGRPRKADRENGASEEPFLNRIRLAEAGIDKKLSSRAQQLAAKPAGMFEGVVREAREKILVGRAIVIDPMKDLNTAEKALKRRVREAQLAEKQRALPDKKYGVILADPEARFEPRSRDTGLDRAADNHYPTSSTEVIAARPVGDLGAPDSIMFLWATVPMLLEAIAWMQGWGFEYKTHFIWDKMEIGTGYWNRNRHELLLVGTRGNVPAPAPGTQWPSVIAERPGAHSQKPDWSYRLIEEYFPNLPRIELNARRRRDGWDAWGNEAPEDGAAVHPQSAVDADIEAEEQIELQRGGSAEAAAAPVRGDAVDAAGAGQSAPVASSDPRARYAALVAADTHKGSHTVDSAASIVRASRDCKPIVPIQQLAADLGHPLGTVKGWTFRLKVTDKARLHEPDPQLAARNRARASQEASP